MPTTDEFYEARRRRDAARSQLSNIADNLVALANKLTNPQGVRVNEMTAYRGIAPNHVMVSREDLIDWERLADAIRAFSSADGNYATLVSDLTPQQRRDLGIR